MSPTPDPGLDAPDLDAALDRVWRVLVAAVGDREAALHAPVVATGGANGPDARVMVLRGADRATATLRFHSDRRAGKIALLAAAPAVAVTSYDAGERLQVRLRGVATVASNGPAVDAAWAATSAFGRRAYQTVLAPGTVAAAATSGLPNASNADEGRANFAVVTVALDTVEWLELAHTGHRRAVHRIVGTRWQGSWLVP